MPDAPGPGGHASFRSARRFWPAAILAVCASFWASELLVGQPDDRIWFVSALAACLAGLAVAVGRAHAERSDAWQALLAAPASLLGPLSALLLLASPVRDSLREAPAQVRARGGELEALRRKPVRSVSRDEPAQPGGADSGIATALWLGLWAAALAFLSGFIVGVWFGLGCQSCTVGEGGGFFSGLTAALVVGTVGFVGLLVVRHDPRMLAGLEAAAAAIMLAATVNLIVDGADFVMDGDRVSVRFLVWVWGLVAALFAAGAAIAWRRRDG